MHQREPLSTHRRHSLLYVTGPTGAPDWGIRFAFIFLFPR